LIDTLVTYLPFYRIHEIKDYFLLNKENLKTVKSIVYVDNVYHRSQAEILKELFNNEVEIRPVNWNDRNLTLLQILEDTKKEKWDCLVIDSDNILGKDFQKIDELMIEAGFDYYNVDHIKGGFYAPIMNSRRPIKRIRKLVTINRHDISLSVYSYKITGVWRGILFIGPKQAVRLSKKIMEELDWGVVEDTRKALLKVEPFLRGHIADEWTLGVVYYYSGLKEIPWIAYSEHHHDESSPKSSTCLKKIIKSTAMSQFAKGFKATKYKRMTWVYLRYKLSQFANILAGIL
jgi:hypothetical protein